MSNAIEVRGLGKSYGSFALRDVSFALPTGYIMGFVGPNGAGKTTTIKSILGITGYSAGEIALFGEKERDEQTNQDIGVVMDSPFYAEEWTAADVEGALSLFNQRWDKARYAGLLQRFQIDRKKKVKELSRGMKVKLMMAVALSHEAKLLILDEPTSGLDPVARDELCELLREFVMDERCSVLFSTHITTDLEKIADHITFILNGQIVFSGPKEDMLDGFVLVKGGRNEIAAEQKEWIIGLREHGTGFDGIVQSENLHKLPKGLLTEPVTLEEIIICINKGAKEHE